MTRGQNQRAARAARLAQQAAQSTAAAHTAAEQTRAIRFGSEPIGPQVYTRTIRYNNNGFTLDQLRGISPPPTSQRVQLIISSPGYGKNGVRSTGWIDVAQVDLSTIEDDFGITLDRLKSVVFDV